MGVPVELEIVSTPENSLVYTNEVYVAQGTFTPMPKYVRIKDMVYVVSTHPATQPGQLAMSSPQRTSAGVSQGIKYLVAPYQPPQGRANLASINLDIGFVVKRPVTLTIDATEWIEAFVKKFKDHVFTNGESFVMDQAGSALMIKVTSVGVLDETKADVIDSTSVAPDRLSGRLVEGVRVVPRVEAGLAIKLTNVPAASSSGKQMFKMDFNFETVGVGGLGEQFTTILRRAFLSRIIPPAIIQQAGIPHTKGVILYGPPGTGKTLIARQISKMLNCAEPKIVDGPSVLSKFVGEAEANIRKLFEEAEKEQAEKGEESQLHVIIFDEFDAICKQRGSSRDNTGVQDNMVNQLLAKIDGVNSLNNVLLIGMTNRIDMIDDAVLRPGRFEVKIEIPLPSEAGRREIFIIHTKGLRKANLLGADVSIEELAALSPNYTGAEIEGVVRAAMSLALGQLVDLEKLTTSINNIDIKKIIVTRADFIKAFEDVKPAFGVKEEDLTIHMAGGIVSYGPQWENFLSKTMSLINVLKADKRARVRKVLVEGGPRSGKTAFAAYLAKNSDFPFAKLLRAKDLRGYSEQAKTNQLTKLFADALKSPLSLIVLDDIERLVEYVDVGPRFSTSIVAAVGDLLNEPVPEGKQLFIIGTTRRARVLDDLGIAGEFPKRVTMPALGPDEVLAYFDAKQIKLHDSVEAFRKILPAAVGVGVLGEAVSNAEVTWCTQNRQPIGSGFNAAALEPQLREMTGVEFY